MPNKKLKLHNITLIGVDCTDLKRLHLAAKICELGCSFGNVKLLSSIKSDDPRVIPIPKIRTTKSYSKFMIKHLAEYIDTEYALIFQYDGFILNPSAWTDEFLKYDYIGAPWYHLDNLRVGNGGFSLRSKRLLDLIGKNYRKIGGALHPEDIWICRNARPFLEKNGMRFAPEEVALQFSKEGCRRGVVWSGEFGFHGAGYTDISKWLSTHPRYKKVLLRKLDDFTEFMRDNHPAYDGTFHVLDFRPHNMSNYKEIAVGKKNYEAREIDLGNKEIKPGHKIVFKRSGVSLKKVPVRTFERTVEKIEMFKTLKELRNKYPSIHVTYPLARSEGPDYKKFSMQRFAPLLGDIVYPKDRPYVIYWLN